MGDANRGSPIARRSGQAWPCGVGPGLCSILDTNFREFLFYVLGRIGGEGGTMRLSPTPLRGTGPWLYGTIAIRQTI